MYWLKLCVDPKEKNCLEHTMCMYYVCVGVGVGVGVNVSVDVGVVVQWCLRMEKVK